MLQKENEELSGEVRFRGFCLSISGYRYDPPPYGKKPFDLAILITRGVISCLGKGEERKREQGRAGRAEGARRKKMGSKTPRSGDFPSRKSNIQAYFQKFSPAARSCYEIYEPTPYTAILRELKTCRSESDFTPENVCF